MDTTVNHSPNNKGGGSKKFIAIIIAAVLLIGGSVAAYTLLNKSPKQKYFAAEEDSIDFLVDQIDKRYEPELSWAEQSQKKPTETDYKLGLEVSEILTDSLGAGEATDVINSSSLKLKTATDYEKMISTSEISADIFGMEIGGLNLGLTKDEITVNLPFVKDTLVVKEKDLPKLLHEIDPVEFTGKEQFDFSNLFKQSELLSEKDREYLKKEYLGMLYDELNEDSFTSAKEKVKVNGKDIDSEKIKMHITEKQLKDMLEKLFDKAAKDKRLKEILKEQYAINQISLGLSNPQLSGSLENEADDFVKEFEYAMKEAKKEVKDFKAPDGIKSTIWINDGLVVKRDFKVSIEDEYSGITTISVKGTQSLKDNAQDFNYTFGLKDEFMDEALNVVGKFSDDKGKIKDKLEFIIDEGKLVYTADETLKDGKRDFKRSFDLLDSTDLSFGKVNWNGNAKYQKDNMNSKNEITVDIPDLGGVLGTIKIDTEAKNVKSVKAPSKENAKDLGSMSIDEIEDYFMNEVIPALQTQFNF